MYNLYFTSNKVFAFISFFFDMEQQAVDSIDFAPIGEVVFDNGQSERASWKFCNSSTLPRSEVLFFTQALLIFIIVVSCLLKLIFAHPPCEEAPMWFSLLFGTVGYLLPNPKLKLSKNE